ncbi:hypothetical protein, partial [Serratia marcescens]|uniref:hypothetical protein n=1 Tax=Serratia marcescens TaxID=615 RepID=UPI002813426E
NPLNTSSWYDLGLPNWPKIGDGDDKDGSFKGKSSSSSISPMKKRSVPKIKDLATIDRQMTSNMKTSIEASYPEEKYRCS